MSDSSISESETNYNVTLADQLKKIMPGWRISGEQLIIEARKRQQPDLILRDIDGLPVVIECKFDKPSNNVTDVELKCNERLDLKLRGRQVEAAVAVLYPFNLKEEDSLHDPAGRLADSTLKFLAKTGTKENPNRFPSEGWLEGGLEDLADFVEDFSISEQAISRTVERFGNAAAEAAERLESSKQTDAVASRERLAKILHQTSGKQTTSMAMTMILSALTFHDSIAANHPDDITPLSQFIKDKRYSVTQISVLKEWEYILDIDYWPIFAVARDLLAAIAPARLATEVLGILVDPALEISSKSASASQELAGQVFGRLITDRKLLATFYTLPSSAALLAELAVSQLDVDWSNVKEVKSLRVADLACGTGALLTAAYRRIIQKTSRHGIASKSIHRSMIENTFIGADVMPAAIHMTAASLSAMHIDINYEKTKTHVMPYGKHQGEEIKIGSLHLIEENRTPTLFGDGSKVTSRGEEESSYIEVDHGSVHLVIMNPPFTRPTKHDGGTEGIPVPSFAGLGTPEEEQRKMSEELKRLKHKIKGTAAGHGNAGLGSHFIDLALVKVKRGGIIALILPATFSSGQSWRNARAALDEKCDNIEVISITANPESSAKAEDFAFSADTGMAEVMVVARRKRAKDSPSKAWNWVNLKERPRIPASGCHIAKMLTPPRQMAA